MTQWTCKRHGISLTVEGDRRTFSTPPGSIKGLPPCRLLIMHPLTEGKFGDCEIVKEQED